MSGVLTEEIIKSALDSMRNKTIQETAYFECSAEEAPIIIDWIEHPEHFREVLDEVHRRQEQVS